MVKNLMECFDEMSESADNGREKKRLLMSFRIVQMLHRTLSLFSDKELTREVRICLNMRSVRKEKKDAKRR